MSNQHAYPIPLSMNLQNAHPAPSYAQAGAHRVVFLPPPAHAHHNPITVTAANTHHAFTRIPATSVSNRNGPQRVVVLQAADPTHYQAAPPIHYNNVRALQHQQPSHHLDYIPPAPMVAQAPGVSYVRHVLPTNWSQQYHTSIAATDTSYCPTAMTGSRPVTTTYVDLKDRPVNIIDQPPVASRVHVYGSTAIRVGLPSYQINAGLIEKAPCGSSAMDARGKNGKMYSKRCMVNATKWNDKYQDLKAFREEHGHCLVPTRFKHNPSLACWVMHQRAYYHALLRGKQNNLTKERIDMLDSIGFVWEVRSRKKC